MEELGLTNKKANVQALIITSGNVEAAINFLLNWYIYINIYKSFFKNNVLFLKIYKNLGNITKD